MSKLEEDNRVKQKKSDYFNESGASAEQCLCFCTA